LGPRGFSLTIKFLKIKTFLLAYSKGCPSRNLLPPVPPPRNQKIEIGMPASLTFARGLIYRVAQKLKAYRKEFQSIIEL
jgi:hypothetical protein